MNFAGKHFGSALLRMKKQWLTLLCLGLAAWPLSTDAAPAKTEKKDNYLSQVPPEPYHAIQKPEWVHGCNDSQHPSAQIEYPCMKVAVPLKIDGKLDEWSWRTAPEIHFLGYVNKTDPPFPTWAKSLWDDRYLYIAFRFEEPDIRVYWAFNAANASYRIMEERLYPKQYYPKGEYGPEESRVESSIMILDRFAKIFLDPDGDGINYLETHINALGNTFTAWYELPIQGCPDRGIPCEDNHVDMLYAMPGIRVAVFVDGTINNPTDIDNAWTVEVAIPWETLKKFSVKKRPPLPGEAWGLHLARVYRTEPGARNEYWGWPFLDVRASHQTEKYGKLRFVDNPRFKSFFSLDLPQTPEGIAAAAHMGVKQAAVPADWPEAARKAAAENGIRLFPVVSLMEWNDAEGTPVWQKLSPEQERFFAAQEGRDIDAADPDHAMRARGFKDTFGYRHGFARGYVRGRNVETFAGRILCPSSPENREMIKKRIKAIVGQKENAGVFLEGIGWQNYTDCKCPLCRAVKDKETIWTGFINEMADYAKSLRPDILVAVHLFPGMPLSVQNADSCHADLVMINAAWYDLADLWLIRKQAKSIGETGKRLIPAVAVGDSVTDISITAKTPERMEMELNAVVQGGSGMLAVKGIDCLLRHPELYRVFSGFAAHDKPAK